MFQMSIKLKLVKIEALATIRVILGDPPFQEEHIRFTTVPLIFSIISQVRNAGATFVEMKITKH